MMRIFLLSFLLSSPIFAASVKQDILSAFQKVGDYSFSYLFWDVYDIALYKKDKDLALSLEYKRVLKGEDISQRSIEEIQQLGFKDKRYLQKWRAQMDQIFPDVQDGTVLTGVRQGDKVYFYQNNHFLDVVDDPVFAQYFFDIWLAPHTSEPEMRAALLGSSFINE